VTPQHPNTTFRPVLSAFIRVHRRFQNPWTTRCAPHGWSVGWRSAMRQWFRSGAAAPRMRGVVLPLCAALLASAALGTTWAAPKAAAKTSGPAVGKLAFRDLEGKRYTERDVRAAKATVFLFLSTECPISSAYT